jgi:carboxyl-terminal processing protease
MASPASPARVVSKNIYFLTIAAALIVGFVAGTRDNELFAAVGPVLGIKVATGTIDTSSLQDTYRQLKANYDGPLDPQKLIDGANKGLAEAAGDKYTVYMTREEAKQFNDDLSGQIGGGIGAEIGIREGQPTVLRVLADNPAERAGMKAGDVITKVNNSSADGWAADKTANAIRGEVGTTVKLQVKRGEQTQEFTITRASISSPSVESSVKDGLGILTISRFDSETGGLARKAAEDFKRQNVRGVVLDLRDNGGGYLSAAQEVAGLWLNDQVVVSERTGGVVTDELKSGSDPVLGGVRTVVLVNGASASASEIVAGALQDHGAATLVGEKTFGKGTVQKMVDLPRGAELKVTIARWYTPKGRNITSEGIAPDKTVGMSADDVNAGRDPQMDAATGFLSS